jgi:hypothetical protein
MLRAYLHHGLRVQDRVTRGLGFGEHVAHGLFDIGILSCLGRHLENRRMRMLGGRDEHAVEILHREQLFRVLDRSRRPAMVLFVRGDGLLPIRLPQIADRCHLGMVAQLQFRHDQIEIVAPMTCADVSERNAVIRSQDFFIRRCRARHQRAAGNQRC